MNDKIASLVDRGVLLPLKKGVYVLGSPWRQQPLCLPLIANNLYGPSCVSLEYALAWHGVIPEGVFTVTSVTSRRAKAYETSLGYYTYQHIPESLVLVGARMESVTEGKGHYLMAGPTKALCDKLLLTRNLRLASLTAMETFLEDDLRVDRAMLKNPEPEVVTQYLSAGHKVPLFRLLGQVLEQWS
ncbi:type IV toxin-antitoxin system AbiEi family antitoxin domain-containing protein [Saccharospirillum impatiens]|uniref:type IV toxin-antitoxin system AbiEi family antitoxin domain-containing protein n=1 Tax=Saccharospirillum impatiens TaxID=169438 RepID=UPI0012FCEA9E|nr:hypothetical protein [Saccharospirillum impatiens]